MRHVHAISLGLLVACLSLVGCSDPPEPVTLPALGTEVYASPEAVSKATLETIQAELAARAERKGMEALAYREQLLQLAAAEAIQAEIDAVPRYKTVTGDDATPVIVSKWPAMLGFYRETLMLDQIAVESRTATEAVTLVPAKDAAVRMTCAKSADGRWRVSRIEFSTPKTVAVSSTTSQPAP